MKKLITCIAVLMLAYASQSFAFDVQLPVPGNCKRVVDMGFSGKLPDADPYVTCVMNDNRVAMIVFSRSVTAITPGDTFYIYDPKDFYYIKTNPGKLNDYMNRH